MCLSQCSERFLRFEQRTETVGVHIDVLRKTLKMKAHSEKFMNVSDMQAPDEDDRHDEQSRSKTIKANSKIVKERIWTQFTVSPTRS